MECFLRHIACTKFHDNPSCQYILLKNTKVNLMVVLEGGKKQTKVSRIHALETMSVSKTCANLT